MPTCLLLVLLQESGDKWSSAIETQLCFEMKTFLLAGHETSSAMLSWTLYELSQSKEKMLKVGGCKRGREAGTAGRMYNNRDERHVRGNCTRSMREMTAFGATGTGAGCLGLQGGPSRPLGGWEEGKEGAGSCIALAACSG